MNDEQTLSGRSLMEIIRDTFASVNKRCPTNGCSSCDEREQVLPIIERKLNRLEELEVVAASMAEALNRYNARDEAEGRASECANKTYRDGLAALAAYHNVGLEEQTSSSATIGDTK